MFCPRCSNQQTSDSARYCTKCGFQISAVKELVANDGVPITPVTANPIQSSDNIDRRIRKRGRMLNIALLVIVISLLSDLRNGNEIFPRAMIGAVLIAILFARVVAKTKYSFNFTKPSNATLTDHQVPVQHQEPRRIVTAEMVPVPSVTEGTTKLLVNQPHRVEQDYP